MNDSLQFLRGLLILLIVLGFAGWRIWRALKRSDDPGKLVARLIQTLVLFGFVVYVGKNYVAAGVNTGDRGSVIVGMLGATAIAIVLGLIWAPSWASMLFRPLLDVFDGGAPDGILRPQYSLAEAKRVKGRPREAIAEIRKQLELFPTDLRLQLLLAEINVADLNDLQSAEVIITKLAQQDHSPVNISSALQQLADWHLKYGQDPVSARETLEKIIARFPGTAFAQTAAQRIAHLASVDQLLQHHDLPTLKLKEYKRDLGLRKSAVPKDREDESNLSEKRAAELVEHLEMHPQDTSAREELAKLYALHYGRLDLAIEQLDLLIERPQQAKKDFVRWLELSADLHIKVGQDATGAEAALRRIIDSFPETAWAEMANRRLVSLNQELNVHKKSQVIKLGSYEKDLGLKGQKPIGPPRAG